MLLPVSLIPSLSVSRLVSSRVRSLVSVSVSVSVSLYYCCIHITIRIRIQSRLGVSYRIVSYHIVSYPAWPGPGQRPYPRISISSIPPHLHHPPHPSMSPLSIFGVIHMSPITHHASCITRGGVTVTVMHV
ncbi:hypothetical protein L226DRAFT_36907 [Lentinus tigrinus ALCF2SS1-7]|uniref:uncharacterized protein n=1 Tax=Lentinus tigrinus ALCF2SS1-7 TaxID=1328758 RepID=UPI0011662896|nr:hypothetical protein L226DRAFT_36907 [Lentinus tigrinus ALCF2SS1-7]